MPYVSAIEVCSRRGAIQIHVYLYLYDVITFFVCCSIDSIAKTAAVAAVVAADFDEDAHHNQANSNNEAEREEVMEQTDNEDDRMYSQQHGADMYNGRGRGDAKPLRHGAVAQSSSHHNIECIINGEYSVTCQQDGNGQVYLPFKFISKYFEVFLSLPSELCNVGQ